MDQLPLTGRVAVVSGANQGIGAATAVALAELGADVAVTFLAYRPEDDPDRPAAHTVDRQRGPEDLPVRRLRLQMGSVVGVRLPGGA